ncbi:hypothetical protein [Streptomyces sp. NBC_00582]|uniref:hypothetical protein n=1 Tax=Streptomyces sp. NBC_00582 TaxID=2975783 RepID=UPI002E8157B2|nr:hypothetical protein [Streptomyces sp. NBC_00582]WUB61523.1 hypothetical protein OG852_14540 [Streptomyces sp. NBC_00582]
MHTRTTAAALLLGLTVLTGCSSAGSSGKADTAACKAAMAKQLGDGMASAFANTASPLPTAARPAACAGVDDATAQRLAGEVTKEWLASDQADQAAEDALKSVDPVPVPTDTGLQLTDDCRDWIKTELLDSTGDIDATAGYGACGDLTDDEMTQAVDQVTQELIDATP